MRYFIISLFLSLSGYSQQEFSGVVYDSAEKTPLEYVFIYNTKDNTISNIEGRFSFKSSLDSLTIYKAGYKKIKTTFTTLKDTVFLENSVLELEEVVVTNAKTLFQKIKDSIFSNYLFEPYKEKFFLRAVLRYNNRITRIQDMQGILQRKTLLYTKNIERTPKDYQIEFTNMRKAGVVKDTNKVYFTFPTFYGLLSNFARINVVNDFFTMTKVYFDKDTKIKWKFKATFPEGETKGHYIINTTNNAIEYFEMTTELPNSKYDINKFLHYRTKAFRVQVFFTKNQENKKYTISLGKVQTTLECTNKERSYTSHYKSDFTFTTSESFKNHSFKKNTSATKDIFKLKHSYNEEFWNTQNQLLLTQEMTNFLEDMQKENKEFKIKSNIK